MVEAVRQFAFGENWQSFARQVSDSGIDRAIINLKQLFPNDELRGKRFLDIGCGSGLSMVAALRLGAAEVVGVDIDANSVGAARTLLGKYAPDDKWSVRRNSVFELSPALDGRFPVVHSWGVLHHTGDMARAIRHTSSLVSENGIFALAIYRKTPLCGAWRVEKRAYAFAPRFVQLAIMAFFKSVYLTALLATGRNPPRYIGEYHSNRGMDWHHDVQDWLGGYPYESATPEEISDLLQPLGFSCRMVTAGKAPLAGLLGTGCAEYIARKLAATDVSS